MTGSCAKATVRCELHLRTTRVIVGTNACNNPQPVCPRLPGENYTKCRTICDQQGHAEVQAIRTAIDGGVGSDLVGSVAILSGHTYYCMDCQRALFGAGIAQLRLKPKEAA